MAKLTKEQIALQKESKALLDAQIISAKEHRTILKEINAIQAGSKTTLASIIASQKTLNKTVDQGTKGLTKKQKLQEDILNNEYEQINIVSTLQGGLKGNLKEFNGIGKAAQSISDKLKTQYKAQLKSRHITKATYVELVGTADETALIAKNMEVIAKSPIADGMADLEGYASSAASKMESIFTSVPGGGMLFKYMGGDKLNDQLTSAVTKGAADMAKSMGPARDAMGQFAKKGSKDVVQGGKDMIGSLSDGMKGFIGQVKGIPNIGMMLGIGAALILATALFSIFKSVSEAAHKLSEETGITYTEAKKLNKEARAAQSSMENQLATMEDITAVQSEMVQAMGSAALVSTEVAASVADTAKAFGVSAQTAGQVTAELTQMGMTQQAAADLQLETNAQALKAGVNVAAVQKDIAASAKSSAAYFGGSGKALAKAAIEAQKMGMSIAQMTKNADGLLDIESSLQKQFRAQALTGKSLNFEKARQLALDGKIVEAQQEMLKQAGSIEDFNAMAPHQKKALAEAMNMEVGELQKSLALQKMRGKLTDDELAAANGLNLSAEQLQKMSAKEIQAELAKKNAADKTAAAFDTIKNDLVSALAPAAEAFAGIFAALSPVIKILGSALKIAFLPITLAGKALQFVLDLANRFKGVTMVIGGLLLSNYIQQKLGTAEKRKQLGLLISEKAGIMLNTAMKWLGFSAEQATTVESKQGILAKGIEIAKQIGLNALKWLGFGAEQATTGEKKAGFLFSTYEFIKQTAINAIKTVGLGIELAVNAAKAVGNALSSTGIGKVLASAGALLMKAVAGIWSTLSQIPFGVGLAIAGVATAGLFALFGKAKAQKAGDVGISPKGGPIVASPREGTIFQGTNNDGVEMSPSAGQPNSGGGGGGSSSGGGATTAQISSAQMTQIIEALAKVVTAVQNPPPVTIGEGQVNQIGSKIAAGKSFIS